jgi:HlyD family secretion protein
MNPERPKLDDLRIHGRDRLTSGSRVALSTAIIIVLVVLLAFGGYWWASRSKPILVTTIVAQAAGPRAGERTVLNASGYVTARRAATVSSKVTGKIIEVFIEEGKRVAQDEVLARLDDTNVKASLRLAEARLASATNALEETRVRIREAEQEFRRQTDLLRGKIATQADYDRAEAALLAMKAKLRQQAADIVVAERELATWQQQLDDTIIRAPFSGIVTSKNAQPGEMISPISAGGGFTRTGICTIVDMDSLEIEIDVNESYINRVETDQPVIATPDAYPDWKIPCKVIAIIPTADRQKSTVKVRVGFDKLDKRLLPDMGVKVAFREASTLPGISAGGSGASIPRKALQQQQGRDIVYVVREGRAERRAVTVSAVAGEEVTVTSGLTAGERIVETWPAGLADGVPVRELNSR